MTDKITRGRASKIDLLPAEIRSQLAMMLRDKAHTQQQIRDIINALIEDYGLGDEYKISRTGLNRYASRMENMGAKIRASREMAEVWTKQLGEAPESDVGKLLLEFVKTLAFETSMSMSESEKEISPKVLGQLALVAQRVESAQSVNYKREKEIRKETAQLAAETAEKIVVQAGLSADTVRTIKEQILGIA